MAHRLYDAMPDGLRHDVDLIIQEFRPEPWPVRFCALLSMLLASVEESCALGRPYAINAWKLLVTGLLEHLKPDTTNPECLALMSASASDVLQAAALAHIERDPMIPDFLRATYPEWMTVEELLDEFDGWVKENLPDSRPH